MQSKTITSKLKQIIRLRGQGAPLKIIARAVDISRNTVKKYLRLIEVKGLSPELLLQMQDNELEALFIDPDPIDVHRLDILTGPFPFIEKELQRTG